MKKRWFEWLDRWNPWALRREIQMNYQFYMDLQDRFQMCCSQNIEREKRIKELESKLRSKTFDCELANELAIRYMKEKAQMLKDIKCDRCGKPARFEVDGGHCTICDDNLCANCALWRCDEEENIY